MIELLKPIRIRRLSPWKIDSIKNIITALLADDDSALKELFRAQVEDAVNQFLQNEMAAGPTRNSQIDAVFVLMAARTPISNNQTSAIVKTEGKKNGVRRGTSWMWMSHNVIKLIIARLNIVYLVIGFINQLSGALFIGLDRNVVAKLIQVDELLGADLLNGSRNQLVVDT